MTELTNLQKAALAYKKEMDDKSPSYFRKMAEKARAGGGWRKWYMPFLKINFPRDLSDDDWSKFADYTEQYVQDRRKKAEAV